MVEGRLYACRYTMEELLTNICIYWLNGNIASSTNYCEWCRQTRCLIISCSANTMLASASNRLCMSTALNKTQLLPPTAPHSPYET